jgi:hypothetical protein
MTKYKLKPFGEVNDVYLLYRQTWWIFYSFVSAGSKKKLTDFVIQNNGTIINI